MCMHLSGWSDVGHMVHSETRVVNREYGKCRLNWRNMGIEVRKTIGIDASRANAHTRTGTEWYAFNLIQEFKRTIPDTYRVVLYSREPLRDGLEDLPAHWESRVLKWPWRFWTQIRLSWEMFRHPPDILFVPAHTLPIILPERAAVTLHDVAFMPFTEAYSLPSRLYHRWATRFAVTHAYPILTVSEFSKGEITKWFDVPDGRIIVTPLGFDAERYGPVDDKALAETLRRYQVSRPYFLAVGRLETKKNIGGLLAAYRNFRATWPDDRIALVLVGTHGYGYEDEVREGLPEDVIEQGYVCQDDMRALYAGAEALVFVSKYEGFGLPAIEAFACGTPVIASDTTSLPEVCGDAALFVDPDSPEDIARAMHRIVVDEAVHGHLVEKGKMRVGEYTWKKTAALTWSALREALE